MYTWANRPFNRRLAIKLGTRNCPSPPTCISQTLLPTTRDSLQCPTQYQCSTGANTFLITSMLAMLRNVKFLTLTGPAIETIRTLQGLHPL